MNAVLALLLVGLVVVVAIAAALTLLAVHIHSEERRQALSQEPRTRAAAVVRRVLDAHATPTTNVNRTRAHARR
jgi:flagellar basal body-associated protein FliL